jgi:hypothetical protein
MTPEVGRFVVIPVEAGPEDGPLPLELDGKCILQGLVEEASEVGAAEVGGLLARQREELAGTGCILQQVLRAAEDVGDRPEGDDGSAEGADVAGAGAPLEDASNEPFEVLGVAEKCPNFCANRRVLREELHLIVAPSDGADVDQGCQEPTPEQPRAGAGLGGVDLRDEGAFRAISRCRSVASSRTRLVSGE